MQTIIKIFSSFKKLFKKKKPKKNIVLIYSSDDCKTDDTGGPYEFDMEELNKPKK
tara:strand:- start:205 stop:369 length:165 start_codon:yes stop_codon:yes gene_type:complete